MENCHRFCLTPSKIFTFNGLDDFFLINQTSADQPIQKSLSFFETTTGRTTYIKRGKPDPVKPNSYRKFSVSKLDKSADRYQRFARLSLHFEIASSLRFGLKEAENNIAAVITEDGDQLKTTFVGREEFAKQPSSPTSSVDKKRTNEIVVEKIIKIAGEKGAAIHEDDQAQTSEGKGQGLVSDSDDIGTKIESEQSSNLASPLDISGELMRSRLPQLSNPESTEASKGQLFTGSMGDDVHGHVRGIGKGYQTQQQHASASSSSKWKALEEVLHQLVEEVREQVREEVLAELRRQSITPNDNGGG